MTPSENARDRKAGRVSILRGDLVIGTVILYATDPSMGVVVGQFVPNEHYDPGLHATEVEGVEIEHITGVHDLCARAESGQPLHYEHIHLADWSKTVGSAFGREVTLFGVDVANFD